MKRIAILGAVLIAISAIGFLLSRSGALTNLRQRLSATQTPSPSPFVSPTETPIATPFSLSTSSPFPLLNLPSPTPRGTVNPTAECSYLFATPSEGTIPLTVRFSVSGFSSQSLIREYEYNFGDGSVVLKQTTPSATHIYEKAGTFIATLKLRDQQGSLLDSRDCRRTITAKPKPSATSSATGKTLPNTGPSLWVAAFFVPLSLLGLYLYKRFKLV